MWFRGRISVKLLKTGRVRIDYLDHSQATGINILWSPSDSGVEDLQTTAEGSFHDPGQFKMCYTSYAGSFGTWAMGWTPQYNDRLNRLFNADGAVRIVSVTDLTDNAWPGTGELPLAYDEVLSHPRDTAEAIAAFLGREFDVQSAAGAIQPSLKGRHSKAGAMSQVRRLG